MRNPATRLFPRLDDVDFCVGVKVQDVDLGTCGRIRNRLFQRALSNNLVAIDYRSKREILLSRRFGQGEIPIMYIVLGKV